MDTDNTKAEAAFFAMLGLHANAIIGTTRPDAKVTIIVRAPEALPEEAMISTNDELAVVRAAVGHFVEEQGRMPDAIADDTAIDRFAGRMKAKMAASRAKGRSGWQECSTTDLSRMLIDHAAKGDPVDVANFCMMLSEQQAMIDSGTVHKEAVQAYQNGAQNGREAGITIGRHQAQSVISAAIAVARSERGVEAELTGGDPVAFDPWPEMDALLAALDTARPKWRECASEGRGDG